MDLREAITSAFDSAEEQGTATEAEATPNEVVEAAEPVVAAEPVEAAATVDDHDDTVTAEAQEADDRARDEKGRFAKAETTKAAVEKAVAKIEAAPKVQAAVKPSPQPTVGAAQATEQLRPPSSFKPLAREEWAKTPRAIQEEILRVNGDVQRTLQETAEARKNWQSFREEVAPYEAMIRGSGVDPVKVVGGLLNTAHALQTAQPAQKGAILARIISNYGVPLDAINAALQGQPVPNGQQQSYDPAALTEHVRQSVMEQLAQERFNGYVQKANGEAEEFAKTHEFYDDLRETMHDIMQLNVQKLNKGTSKVAITFEQAYNQAVAMHPEISQVLRQREAAKSAGTAQAATRKARTAASSGSVRTQPAGSVGRAKPSNLRESIEAAWDDAETAS